MRMASTDGGGIASADEGAWLLILELTPLNRSPAFAASAAGFVAAPESAPSVCAATALGAAANVASAAG